MGLFFSLLLTGGIIYLCGYLVDDRKMEHLLSGFDPSKYEDPRAIGRFYGRHLKWMALPAFGLAFLGLMDIPPSWGGWIVIGYTVLVLLWVAWLSFQDHGFKKKGE